MTYQLLPDLTADEYAELRDDIQRNGIRVPVDVDESGAVLDGHHRVRISEELGISYPVRVLRGMTDEQKREHALAVNLHRRQLNRDQKRELIRQSLRADPQLSNRQHAERTGASPTTVGTVRDELEGGGQLSKLDSREGADGRSRTTQRDEPPEDPMLGDAPPPQPPAQPKRDPVMLALRTHKGDEVPYPQPQGKAIFNETTGEGISWAAWSWNPVTGCLHGCTYCYARAIAHRYPDTYPAGFTPLFHEERLDAPSNTIIPERHRFNPAYRRVFVCSMADLYGRWVPDEWIQRVHGSMLAASQWEYLLLTKFPDRYVGLELPPEAWVGTSVDEQKRVRIAERAFRQIEDVKVKWLSLEPLLEPLEFTDLSMFDWVVIGAQTETRQPDGHVPAFAPPFEWVASLVHQARESGCRVHLKPNLVNGRPGMALPDEYPEAMDE